MSNLYLVAATVFSLSAISAHSQNLPPSATDTGARPGHDAGVGESLPLSNKASNIGASDTTSPIAPTLPPAAIGDSGTPDAYLRDARAALVAGHTGEAQEALEMAETRILNRVIPPGQSIGTDDSRLVGQIQEARAALGTGDSQNTIRLIDAALAH